MIDKLSIHDTTSEDWRIAFLTGLASGTFLHHMTAHHQVGKRLAELVVEKGVREDFRTLNELILAEHLVEIDIMCHWWRSWFDEEMPPITAKEYQQMAGCGIERTLVFHTCIACRGENS